jgi:hypothetical protein
MRRSRSVRFWYSGAAILFLAAPYATVNLGSTQPEGPCPVAVGVTYELPYDITDDEQQTVNCFAWRTFIALNWPGNMGTRGQPDTSQGTDGFGRPGDVNPTVWQTYRAKDDVFRDGADPPLPWNDDEAIPPTPSCQQAARLREAPYLPVMRMTTKFGPLLFEQVQASGAPLIDQNHNLVRYEERMNFLEYSYIRHNHLYDADAQATLVTNDRLWLPASVLPEGGQNGSEGGQNGSDGAIEVKAAWRQLTDEEAGIAGRFKITKALIFDPSARTCSNPTTMGLVGLHIVRKTSSMQQMMWATFEQVDNVPLHWGAPDPPVKYSFYNPSCQKPDPCTANATPRPVPPGATPKPVQVERVQPIPAEVRQLNQYVQQLIANSTDRHDSVWQYYQLINVRWPSHSFTPDPSQTSQVPIDLTPFQFESTGQRPVNNVVLETYVQALDCTSCHRGAAIAPSAAASCTPIVPSDFSFMFRNADNPTHYRANHC